MPHHIRSKLLKIPDFDVLSEDAEKTVDIAKKQLEDIGCKNVTIHKFESIGEIVSAHYEIRVGKDTIAFIYQPTACHSYNVLHEDNNDIRVATIDTMLSFYFAFFYSDRDYYDENRILCMAQYLFDVQQRNRLQQKGLLKRFSVNCYGEQETLDMMRSAKADKGTKELKGQRNSKEYESWFLRYIPFEEKMDKEDKRANAGKGTEKGTGKGTGKGTNKKTVTWKKTRANTQKRRKINQRKYLVFSKCHMISSKIGHMFTITYIL